MAIMLFAFCLAIFLCFDKGAQMITPDNAFKSFIRGSLQLSSYLVKTVMVLAIIGVALTFFGWIVMGLIVAVIVFLVLKALVG